jgi:protein-tyrosine-phosphatase
MAKQADSDPQKVHVLFVCLGNSCRSPMAEAIAHHTANDVMIPTSAGTMALGTVAPFTIRVLEERGYDASFLHSKPLTKEAMKHADIIVNMTGVPSERHFKQGDPRILAWQILDPYNGPLKDYRKSCDEVEIRVTELAARIRSQFFPNGVRQDDFGVADGDGDAGSATGANSA